MILSLKRINAIFIKDFTDLSRNMGVSATLIFPPLLAFIYSKSSIESIDSYYLVINMTFAMVATFVQTCLIAEEKEKNTLRSLMLSPASHIEIIIGKSLLTYVSTASVIFITILILGYQPANLGIIAVSIALTLLFYISLGTILGLYTKTVMEASVIVLPVIFLFSFSTLASHFVESYPFLKLANYFPNVQLLEVAKLVEKQSLTGVWIHIIAILFWVLASLILSILIYRRRTFD